MVKMVINEGRDEMVARYAASCGTDEDKLSRSGVRELRLCSSRQRRLSQEKENVHE